MCVKGCSIVKKRLFFEQQRRILASGDQTLTSGLSEKYAFADELMARIGINV
jgi:hypothetical protein